MDTVLQNSCNNASTFLHYSYNDLKRATPYAFGVCTKKISGRRIKDQRENLGLRLEDVCDLLDNVITISRLSNWEHGRNMIGVDEAKKLAPVLGLTAAYILTVEDAERDGVVGDSTVNEFAYVYDACVAKGKSYLKKAIESAKRTYMADRRKNTKLR